MRHCLPSEDGFSFDLHVLGPPPAFVLSQDQTLHSKGKNMFEPVYTRDQLAPEGAELTGTRYVSILIKERAA